MSDHQCNLERAAAFLGPVNYKAEYDSLLLAAACLSRLPRLACGTPAVPGMRVKPAVTHIKFNGVVLFVGDDDVVVKHPKIYNDRYASTFWSWTGEWEGR